MRWLGCGRSALGLAVAVPDCRRLLEDRGGLSTEETGHGLPE
jgi:hypothetical protein